MPVSSGARNGEKMPSFAHKKAFVSSLEKILGGGGGWAGRTLPVTWASTSEVTEPRRGFREVVSSLEEAEDVEVGLFGVL